MSWLLARSVVRDFIADAFAHQKLIAYVGAPAPLLEKAGARSDGDDGLIQLKGPADAKDLRAGVSQAAHLAARAKAPHGGVTERRPPGCRLAERSLRL